MTEERMTWIDPGETTGWSHWIVPDDGPMLRTKHGVVHDGFEGVLRALADGVGPLLTFMRHSTAIGIEQYRLEARTRAADLVARDIVGAVALFGAQHGIEVLTQPPSAKRGVPDAVLKENGLWLEKGDVDHKDARDVNDSQIHALEWGRIHHPPTLEAYWPKPEPLSTSSSSEGSDR